MKNLKEQDLRKQYLKEQNKKYIPLGFKMIEVSPHVFKFEKLKKKII